MDAPWTEFLVSKSLAGLLGAALLIASKGEVMASEPTGSVDPKQAAGRVEEAFRGVKAGDNSGMADLHELGASAIPPALPYLSDPSEDVRREVVGLLKAIGGEAAGPPLAKALADPSADIRERAAAALYDRDDPEALAALPGLGATLPTAVEKGPTAPALLLLAYLPEAESERVLKGVVADPGASPVKLHPWSKPVPAALPARVALSRLGDQEAREALFESIEAGDLADLAFLLEAIREIDSPQVLHVLKRQTLDDTRETRGIPSGQEPKRRLCDDAADAFIKRLGLKVGFSADGARRYSDAEIDAVRKAIGGSIPQ